MDKIIAGRKKNNNMLFENRIFKQIQIQELAVAVFLKWPNAD